MGSTNYLGLTTNNTASGSYTTFLDWRKSINDESNSNMTIIDTFAEDIATAPNVVWGTSSSALKNDLILTAGCGIGLSSNLSGSSLTLKSNITTGCGLGLINNVSSSLITLKSNLIAGSGISIDINSSTSGIFLHNALFSGSIINTIYANQIQFPATQVASADANVLDDYEEGNWTGTLVPASGSITMNLTECSYVKIGMAVFISGFISVTSVSSPSGELSLTGLPFICANNNKFYSGLGIQPAGLEATAVDQITARTTINSTNIILRKYSAGVLSSTLAADVKAGSSFIIGGVYFTN